MENDTVLRSNIASSSLSLTLSLHFNILHFIIHSKRQSSMCAAHYLNAGLWKCVCACVWSPRVQAQDKLCAPAWHNVVLFMGSLFCFPCIQPSRPPSSPSLAPSLHLIEGSSLHPQGVIALPIKDQSNCVQAFVCLCVWGGSVCMYVCLHVCTYTYENACTCERVWDVRSGRLMQ